MDKLLEKLSKHLEIINDGLTKEEFVEAFETVVDLVLQIEKRNASSIEAIEKMLVGFMSNLSDEHKSALDKVVKDFDGKLSLSGSDLKSLKDGHGSLITELKSLKTALVDANMALNSRIDAIAPIPTDSPEQVRDKLHSLRGDERLDRSAIKGLQEEIQELKSIISRASRGRGMRKVPIIKRENLSSQCDGSRKTFTLPKDTVEVLGVYGSQFPINFNPGTDWTFAGRTLTLTDEVSAPASGQTLYALIEVLFY